MTTMEMHFASIWEGIADEIGDRPALVHGDVRRTWAEFEQRAARLAGALTAAGAGHGTKVALYLHNGPEYLETQFGAFKQRAVPVNVNYRYLDDELHYLLDNSDAEALVFHSSLADRVVRVAPRLERLRLLVEVDDGGALGTVDGAVGYEALLAAHDPAPRITRAEDDLYMLYTGGTTGMPKGVMYAIGGLTATFVSAGLPLAGLAPPADPADIPGLVAGAVATGALPISIPACPLMHGTGVWLGAFTCHLAGGTVVTLPSRSFDAHELLATIVRERATTAVIVGDAFARPIVRALTEGGPDGPYDTSSLRSVISSGVMWSAEVKEELLDLVPQLVLIDAIGSSEGSMGVNVAMRGMAIQTARFDRMPTTKVFTEDGRPVEPGSDEIGLVAAGGNVPLGYYKDEEKSARTFKVIDGERYSFPGDLAKVAADGSIILLGRGSQVINTAGEKVFPEEVEEAVKRVPGVVDCLVVGLPDERFGQIVTAVASCEAGVPLDEAAVITSVKSQLAGYKAPRRVVFVAEVPRAPNGKADYPGATELARASVA